MLASMLSREEILATPEGILEAGDLIPVYSAVWLCKWDLFAWVQKQGKLMAGMTQG